MELVMAAQDDRTPWALDQTDLSFASNKDASNAVLHGRGFFSELGVVRRKPCQYLPSVSLCYFGILSRVTYNQLVLAKVGNRPRRRTAHTFEILLRQTLSEAMHLSAVKLYVNARIT